MDVINELAPAQIALDTFFESTRRGMKLPLALRVAARDVLQGTFEAGSKEEALAIGATKGYRIDAAAIDGFFVATQLSALITKEGYDLVICGRESIDYNGAMVHGLIAQACGYAFINTCVQLEIEGNQAKAVREIDGGNEKLTATLPLVIGAQKGLVEESDLKIPNMRGIMMARQKPIEVLPAVATEARTVDVRF